MESSRTLRVVLFRLLLAVSLVASGLFAAPHAGAQPRVSLGNSQPLEHGESVNFDSLGVQPNVLVRVAECPSATSVTDCVDRGEVGTDARGQIIDSVIVLREIFVNGVRSDCAELNCVLKLSDGVNEFIVPIQFSGASPMPAITVTPNVNLANRQKVTVTANDYEPQVGDGTLFLFQCATEYYPGESCVVVAGVKPNGSVSFRINRVIPVAGTEVDCGSAVDACFLRLTDYEARWSLGFTEQSLRFRPHRNLADGDKVVVKVTSTYERINVEQCVRGIGCIDLDTKRRKRAIDGEWVTQNVGVEAQRYVFAGNARHDCADGKTKCSLRVFGGKQRAGFLGNKRIKFAPEASIELPNRDLAVGESVPVQVEGLPSEAKTITLYQCLTEVVSPRCVVLREETVTGADMRRRVTFQAEIPAFNIAPSVDCTARRGACYLVMNTAPPTVRLAAPLNFE